MTGQHDIESIKEGLRECLALATPRSLAPLAEALKASLTKLDEPMQLAIIGKISSSKSTLVNAILGKDGLMSTGHKEVTYNVGWLKYGPTDSDIIIHYKDSRPAARKSVAEFANLSVLTSDAEIDNISHIELFDDSEILREINIIDTPGLDALRGKDSQNTLDFISKVRPDAVVMLFTHSVAENTLEVVRQFNAGAQFNPLNAIGVLSKIDVLWQETIPRTGSALAIGRRMVANRMKRDPMLRRTLFNLYPISALLYMASATLTDDEVNMIARALAEAPEEFARALNSMPRFLGEAAFSLTEAERRQLADKLGLYGIYLIMRALKNGEAASAAAMRPLLFAESGAKEFSDTLHNHFGSRAKLIKTESVYQRICQEITKARASVRDQAEQQLLANIAQRIEEVFSSIIHEHNEYEMLNRIYDGTLQLDAETAHEFCRLCGEEGDSASARLGLAAGSSIEAVEAAALAGERRWRRELALEPDPAERQWMRIILKSYSLLRHQIAVMKYQYERARAFFA